MNKIRIALFSNAHWGASLIHELSEGPFASCVEIVGVCTDRASWDDERSYACLQSLTPDERGRKLHFRTWNDFFELGEEYYEHCRVLVPDLASRYRIETFPGMYINKQGKDQITDEFADALVSRWRPNLILSGFFGARIPTDVVRYVTGLAFSSTNAMESDYLENATIREALQVRNENEFLGCYNFHPSSYQWPSRFAGGQPFKALSDAASSGGLRHFVVTMHAIRWEYDSGTLYKRSSPIPLIPGIHPLELYLSCTQGILELTRSEVRELSLFRRSVA